MKKDSDSSSDQTELRHRAELSLQEQPTYAGQPMPTAEESLRLVHELQVHQIELELQNQALQEMRRQLEQNLERYTDLYDFAPVGYATLASDGAILQINLAGAQLLGIERADLIGRRLGLFVSAETQPVFNTFIDQTLAGIVKTRCELVLTPLHTPPVYLQLQGIGLASDEDRQCRVALLDITERKRAEEALRVSEEKYRTIADFTYDWEYWLNPNGQYRYISPSCERITGYPPEEFLTNPGLVQAMTHPEDQPRVAWHNTYVEEEPVDRLDFRIITRDGQERWIGHACQPVYSPDGRFLGRRGSNRDITERKQLEKKLRRSLDEKEVLFREVHHRVKNNFAAIISLVELHHENVTDLSTSALLTQLTQRLRSMSLVHELLYESESLDQIDFHRYLQTLTSYLQDAFNPDGAIRLEANAPGVWMSLDHAIPCGLIVNELVTNALKYAFPGGQPRTGTDGCEIQVVAHGDQTAYTLIIADNGVGFPEGLNGTNSPHLGLRLVHMLGQHQLQGRIEFDCTSGTRFTLRFQRPPSATSSSKEDTGLDPPHSNPT
jgi:PAS domain S-box-containing protein